MIFNDWVPYDERALYLMEADLGVSTHHAHLETRYAFRTRMLDYLWARLPIVCTEGDHFGDLVRTTRTRSRRPARRRRTRWPPPSPRCSTRSPRDARRGTRSARLPTR